MSKWKKVVLWILGGIVALLTAGSILLGKLISGIAGGSDQGND